MTVYKAKISDAADKDLKEIYRYIRDTLQNRSAAEKFLRDTVEAACSLQDYPYSHAIVSTNACPDTIVEEVRQFNYRENYCFFYMIEEEEKIVTIIKIVNNRMDQSKILKSLNFL